MSQPLLTITAYGLPAPQGSKRHVGNGVMVESSKRVKPWRDDVKNAAERFIESQRVRSFGWIPLDAPLAVSMVFTMPKPASAPKRRRTWPMRTPDLSKLIRSTEDALTDAGIWRDDARVVECTASKAYPGEAPLALTSPGVVIRIWRLDEIAEVPEPEIRWEYGMPDGDEPDGLLPLDGTPRVITPRMVRRPLTPAGPWEPALRIAPECSTTQMQVHATCDGCDCRCHEPVEAVA